MDDRPPDNMSTELVLSRKCRHVDWCTIPDTKIEFCKRCGFALVYAAQPSVKDAFSQMQVQPRAGATFLPAASAIGVASNHRYRALNLDSGRQIRILILKAGNFGDSLRCELEHVNLQQGPVYEALSYTWADEENDDSLCRRIRCDDDGGFIAITKNCDEALRYLRRPGTDRRLWVDAISIDQTNVQERNHQVKNMIAIFRSAIRVLVYLGQGNENLRRLVDHIGCDTEGHLPHVYDFVSLFQSRWFHRVWILQEIAVAKSVLVVYEDKRMSWTDLIEHTNLYLRLLAARNLPLILPPVISYGLQQNTMRGRQLQGDLDLPSILRVSRNCSCKDARDKVYAILGLLHNQSQIPLLADYSASVTAGWVYLQAAAWYLDSTKSVNILSLVEGTSQMSMPSWVPDWTGKSLTSLPAQYPTPATQVEFRLTSSIGRLVSPNGARMLNQGSSNQESLNQGSFYPLNCILNIRGRRCGTLWTDATIFDVDPRSSKRTELMIQRLDTAVQGRLYSTDQGAHWLHDPLQNLFGSSCNRRKSFWKQIMSAYLTAAASDVRHDTFYTDADVPLAFGGLCRTCFALGATRDRVRCCCTGHGKEMGHYDNSELESFVRKLEKYSTGRRLFGTDHSLGFGPMDVNDWDQIWELEGLDSPMVLRRKGSGYVIVGACYVHALGRVSHRCATCEETTLQENITLEPGTAIAPRATRHEIYHKQPVEPILATPVAPAATVSIDSGPLESSASATPYNLSTMDGTSAITGAVESISLKEGSSAMELTQQKEWIKIV